MKLIINKTLPVWTRVALLLLLVNNAYCFECKHMEYDFQILNRTWTYKSGNVTYKVNFCAPLPQDESPHCHANTSVCMIYNNGTAVSAGNFTAEASQVTGGDAKDVGEMWILMAGDACQENPGSNLTTSINLKCGPTMGSLKLLDYMLCTSYFEWESDVYCTGDMKPTKEVPCYVYDEEGHRYDLSPLAMKKGGYLVSSEMDTDIYINVCRDINPVGTTSGCPKNSGACRRSGSTFIGLGEPTDELKLSSDGRLMLKYTSSVPQAVAGCTTKPTTTIIFICPQGQRGVNKEPLIVNDFDCQYVIEWETEYACPESKLHNNTCLLTKKDADIDFDLRPLAKPRGSDSPYKVNYTDSYNTTYYFYLNVCEELGIECPDEDHKDRIPACQTKSGNSSFGHKMGSTDHTQLRYADGELTLTYKGGELCHHNRLQRQTVISFICQKTAANGGIGYPEFDREADCVYFFTWKTAHACLDHPADETCRVNAGGKRFDLSSLVRRSGSNWEGLHEANDQFGSGQYFINLCHNVIQEREASRCDPGAAICYREFLRTRNLGRYESDPTYDSKTNSIQIQYTNGDSCGNNKKMSSTITFICKPGDLQSAPSLIRVSDDKCLYDFEWHSAAACVLHQNTGTNCKVSDADSGYSFDLSRLTLPPGKFYTADAPADSNHDYLINVCGPVSGTACDKLNMTNPGICQAPKDGKNGDAFVTGQWKSDLRYFDGMINLTYSDGSPYHDKNATPRKSEIAFLCDQDAGIGTPKFLSEVASEHYYGFEWRTAYACPNAPIECTASDSKSNQEYDLSGLSMSASQGNWAVEGTANTKYYINVCRPVNTVNIGTGCDAFTSVCRTKIMAGKEQMDVSNMGQVKSGLVIEGEGRLKLRYEGGVCNNGTANVAYVTNIQFLCMKDALVSSPSVPLQDSVCEYTILWNTASACPLQSDNDTDHCTAKDPNSDYMFNLNPLSKAAGQTYTVNVSNTLYKLNICGNLSTTICDEMEAGKPASVCQVKNGIKTSLATAGYKLDFSETGRMALVYDGVRLSNGQRESVQINFECAPEVDLGIPEFVRKEQHTHVFNFLTSLACSPREVDCVAQDEAGNEYNLGSLGRDNGWTVMDSSGDGTTYYINVCRPVNNIVNSACPDGPIGGCQVASNHHSYNMGYIQSKPVAHGDTVSLHYRNGDVCHKGKPNESHRSTRINFFCSKVETGPIFETETSTCEYIFNWRTPAACALKSNIGDSCKVVDPRYGYEFDLNKLKKTGSDYHVTQDDYTYLINVCAPLQEAGSCDVSTGVGACQTKTSDSNFTPVNAGKANSKLAYSSGELTLTYTGGKDKCHGQYERQTIIKFTCDISKNGSDGPLFIEESENCHYVFEWPTHYACPPIEEGACAITGSDMKNYDLSSLSLSNDNYEYTDRRINKRFIFNVCRSLIRKPNATCPYNAAVCMVDLTKSDSDTDKYHNIGEVNSGQIKFDNNRLILVYNNGELCSNGKDHVTTHITFMCDKDAHDTSPTGHFMVGECDHHFLWSSAVACPLGTTHPDTGDKSGNLTCRVTNPATGTQFDLSSLKLLSDKPWYVNDSNGHMLEFNVCGSLSGSKCLNKSSNMGACQSEYDGQKRMYNAGNSVGDIWFDDGVVILNLTGGDRCHNGRFQRNTIISFECNNHQGRGRPMFVDETEDCTYYISWHTDLVCDNEIKCTVNTDDFHTLDLSPLSKEPDHIVSSSKDGSLYHLSVCKSLNPVTGVLCPAGSSVCQDKLIDGKTHTSLGKPKSAPTFDSSTGDVTLVYVNGSQCDTDQSKNFTSKVVFHCLPGPIRSLPTFVDKVGCEFLFSWDTSVVCYDKEPAVPSDICGYKDTQLGTFYNFTALQTSDPMEVTDTSNNKYQINMCGSVKTCGTAMVCRSDGISFGEPHDFQVNKEGGMLKFVYATGAKCPDGSTAKSEILLECDRTADGIGKPVYLTGINCMIQFLWRTPIVCPPLQTPCSAILDGHLYDLSLLMQEKGAWNLTDYEHNTYWINLCTAINPSNQHSACGKTAGACRKTKDGQVDILGSVTAQKKLYKDSSSGAIVLEYGHGDTVCAVGERRTNNKPATTKINFICGNTYGGPAFVVNDTNKELCIFEFNWKTKLACAVKSQQVQAKNGKILDPRSGGTFNLLPILSKSYTYNEKLDAGKGNTYKIRLDGNSSNCIDGVVCLVKSQQQTNILGTHTSETFSVDDDILEATYTSNERCKGDQSQRNISSVIQFHCSVTDTGPKLMYRSKNCVFVFTWDTPVACLTAVIIEPVVAIPPSAGDGSESGSSKSPSSSMSGNTVGGIVAVFLAAIVLCILLVVFHKQERRAACFSGVRKLVGHKSSEYTQLPTDATDDMQGDLEDILTITDAADTETNREDEPIVAITPLPAANYHDDSDEDLLA